MPIGTRQVPLMFGGMVPAAFDRVARWGEGYIGGSLPPSMVAPAFQGVRTAWKNAGREGTPRLVAIAYFALGDIDKGRGNVWDYYISAGDEAARLITGGVKTVVYGHDTSHCGLPPGGVGGREACGLTGLVTAAGSSPPTYSM